MNLSWTIAKRYFVAKKSNNLVNLISKISLIGVATGTIGLIIVLSVFNGFGDLILSLYNSFDPDIRITVVEGKTFQPESASLSAIQKLNGVELVTECLEENGLLRYRERQCIATLKGVTASWLKTSNIRDKILAGELLLKKDSTSFMIAGIQIAYTLGLRMDDPLHRVAVYMPKKGIDASTAVIDPNSAFEQKSISASGVFSIQQDFDAKFVIVPIDFMREILNDSSGISAIELKLSPGADQQEMQKEIQKITGDKFVVKNRLQQHDFLYKILYSEKAAVYIILGFILMIAAFNLFGTLSMLILDKKEDINILVNLGAPFPLIRKIFLFEGLFISVGGAIAGMLFGAIICLIQQEFGIIKLENATGFVTDAYPVSMQLNDFIIVFGIVFVIGFTAAWYTSGQIVRRQLAK